MADISTVQSEVSDPRVVITSPFWARRREQIAESVIPYQWKVMNDEIDTKVPDDPAGNQSQSDRSHAIANLEAAAGRSDDEFSGMVFQDSDVYKWLEEAAYSLSYHPNEQLRKLCDRTVDLIAEAQQDDGYLDTPFQIGSGPWAKRSRFSQLQQSHEMYVMGHYIEAGVAYHAVTGNKKALGIACRMADCLDANFGPEEGKIHGADGHPEVELALAKLYETTGEGRYLELAQYLIEIRGQDPQFYARQQAGQHGDNIMPDMVRFPLSYFQADKPVCEQDEANGHAVRVGYLCTGIASVARLTGDKQLLEAAKRLWSNIVDKRMYITGAIGSTHVGESFTYDYDLPNDLMYGETCASVAMSKFASQMLRIEPNGEYADVLERELFNGALTGISLDGKQYYYVNPLESDPAGSANPDRHHVLSHRVDWFGCACCPANIARLIASVDQYIYTELDGGGTVLSHQFIANNARFGNGLSVVQKSDFPWEGHISYELTLPRQAAKSVRFGIRIPAWSLDAYSLSVNGEVRRPQINQGFVYFDIAPGKAVNIDLDLDMSVQFVRANTRVRDDAGCLAVQRGPLIYCAEEADNPGPLWSYAIEAGDTDKAVTAFDAHLLSGVETVSVPARREASDGEDAPLYMRWRGESNGEKTTLNMIPYYAWANREVGGMRVFFRRA